MPLRDIDHMTYWAAFHRAEMGTWSRALATIAERHDLDLTDPVQAPQGRNVVLFAGSHVVKLIPPFWREMGARECRALQFVEGALSVATPRLLVSGDVGAWTYIVMERLPGRTYGSRDDLHRTSERLSVATLQGRLAREISQLDVTDEPVFRRDWPALFAEQWDELPERLTGLPPALAATAADYAAAAGDLTSGDHVFLHGDVMCVNFLPPSDAHPLTLLDWSDAVLGPVDHEFISPLMHQFRGAPDELERFWSAYGPVPSPAATQHRIMARSILTYAHLLPRYLADLPGPPPTSWDEAARRFCRIPE